MLPRSAVAHTVGRAIYRRRRSSRAVSRCASDDGVDGCRGGPRRPRMATSSSMSATSPRPPERPGPTGSGTSTASILPPASGRCHCLRESCIVSDASPRRRRLASEFGAISERHRDGNSGRPSAACIAEFSAWPDLHQLDVDGDPHRHRSGQRAWTAGDGRLRVGLDLPLRPARDLVHGAGGARGRRAGQRLEGRCVRLGQGGLWRPDRLLRHLAAVDAERRVVSGAARLLRLRTGLRVRSTAGELGALHRPGDPRRLLVLDAHRDARSRRVRQGGHLGLRDRDARAGGGADRLRTHLLAGRGDVASPGGRATRIGSRSSPGWRASCSSSATSSPTPGWR